jgi:hypothetical protein
MARPDYDDDWDDDELDQLEIEDEPGILTTTRILVGLVLVMLVSIVVARLVLFEKPEFAEVTPRLFGLWTTSHPENSDRYVEFRKNDVIFGTGGTGVVKYKVLGMDTDRVGDIDQYTIFYRDLAGAKREVNLFIEEPGEILRFTDNAEVRWTRWAEKE